MAIVYTKFHLFVVVLHSGIVSQKYIALKLIYPNKTLAQTFTTLIWNGTKTATGVSLPFLNGCYEVRVKPL